MACLFHLVAVVQCYHPGFKHQTKFSIIMAASEIEAYEWNCRPLTLQDIWAQQHVMSSNGPVHSTWANVSMMPIYPAVPSFKFLIVSSDLTFT